MSALQIMLLIIGVIFFIGSFFVTEKLSSSDMEQLKKIGEKEVKVMIDKQLRDATASLETAIGEQVALASDDFSQTTEKELKDKVLSMSEYADTVLNSMNETHNQIMFLYDRLNDKQEMVSRLTGELQASESNLLALNEHIETMSREYEVTLQKVDEAEEEDMRKQQAEAEMQGLKDAFMAKIQEDQDTSVQKNDDEKSQILELYKEGYSEVEIAKRIGKGLGEIKLILGLFDEEYRG
ncbi:MAG: hypothetical protein J6N76_09200 [Lachnospiraceae bacterium]|nr:hypothetical protein [Lachnospiraceae bacterium]